MTGKNVLSWKPAPMTIAPPHQASLGAPPETFIESPLLALATDFTAASASAFIAHGFGKVGNPWSTFFWVVSAMSTVKFLHDLSRP